MRAAAQLVATVGALTGLLAALLVLGTHVVVQGASTRLRLLWLAAVTALLMGALGAGVLALVLNGIG